MSPGQQLKDRIGNLPSAWPCWPRQKLKICVALFREAAEFKNVSAIIAYGKINSGFGKIENEGTVADFAGVKLAPNGEKEARRYLEAEPGDDLNLDAREIEAFRAVKSASKDGAVPIQKVETLIREGLLARYQAYHTKGLAGIAPYARKKGHQTLASDELSIATKQTKLLAKYLPSVYNALAQATRPSSSKKPRSSKSSFSG